MKRFFTTTKTIAHATLRSLSTTSRPIEPQNSVAKMFDKTKEKASTTHEKLQKNIQLMQKAINEVTENPGYEILDVSKTEETVNNERLQCYPGSFGQ